MKQTVILVNIFKLDTVLDKADVLYCIQLNLLFHTTFGTAKATNKTDLIQQAHDSVLNKDSSNNSP